MTLLKLRPGPGTPTLGQQAYLRIEEMIVTLQLGQGEMLSEAGLSERTGFGRTPVREALQRLEREGLVAIKPQRGVIVTELQVSQYLALIEARRPSECQVGRLAARRADDAQRRSMAEIADRLEQLGAEDDGLGFTLAGREFHGLPARAAGNPVLESMLSLVHGRSRRFWYAHYRKYARLTEAAERHAARLRLIAAGDEEKASDASSRLMDYLEDFAKRTIDPDFRLDQTG